MTPGAEVRKWFVLERPKPVRRPVYFSEVSHERQREKERPQGLLSAAFVRVLALSHLIPGRKAAGTVPTMRQNEPRTGVEKCRDTAIK